MGNHPTLYVTYSTGAQACDSVLLQKLQGVKVTTLAVDIQKCAS